MLSRVTLPFPGTAFRAVWLGSHEPRLALLWFFAVDCSPAYCAGHIKKPIPANRGWAAPSVNTHTMASQLHISPWQEECRSSPLSDRPRAMGLLPKNAGFDFRYSELGIANPPGVVCQRCELVR